MSRITNEATKAEIRSARHQMCHLAVIEFDGETVRISDWDRTITWNGNEYPGCGDFAGYDPGEETADMEVQTFKVTLSGVDRSYISDILNRNYLNRDITVYRAYIDGDTGEIAGDPVIIAAGQMNEPSFADDAQKGEFGVVISASNQWVKFSEANGLRTNDNTHQEIFPGDKGFEFSAQILDSIKWGKA